MFDDYRAISLLDITTVKALRCGIVEYENIKKSLYLFSAFS